MRCFAEIALLLLVQLVATSGQTCRNGMDGIERGNSCCDVNCRACNNNANCGNNQTPSTLDGNDCCADQVLANDVACSDAGNAPCVLDTLDTVCASNGFAGFEGTADDGTTLICCSNGCGQCGGSGCALIWDPLVGADCCTETVSASGELCSVTGESPCIIDYVVGDTVCVSNGFAGFEGTANDGTPICCSNGCGQCGGPSCGTAWDPLVGTDCCAGQVNGVGELCSVKGESPCIIDNFACVDDTDCDEAAGEICCPDLDICEVPDAAGACGDPHMTGFRGQKFDFIGEDGEWYCVLEDGPALQLNMRVTSPVPSVPEITYITGISIRTADLDGLSHTIIIQVTDPHNLASSCHEDVSPCLADGALSIEVDGREVLPTPGTTSVGPGVSVSAANLPGACRSFGFETYWESKSLEYAQLGRKLGTGGRLQDMAEWILGDPTATNMAECVEYVARATAQGGDGLFAHESEHTSFQIMTPLGAVRLSHGRLHQAPMRDPADQFDMPDHLTWQMNLAIDHNNVSPAATGILGETLRPTIDGNGKEITHGMAVIRGSAEDYRVEGPLGTAFALHLE